MDVWNIGRIVEISDKIAVGNSADKRGCRRRALPRRAFDSWTHYCLFV